MSLHPATPVAVNSRIKLLLLSFVITLVPAIGLSQEYTVTNLGTLGGLISKAAAVNDSGEVVGFAAIAGYNGLNTDAFLYANGTMTDLAPGNSALGSEAVAINDQGHVLFQTNVEDGWESYLWNGVNSIDLGLVDAVAINENDMVVGNIENGHGWYWVYANGQMDFSPNNPLPSPWVDAYAESVNNSGQITGLCSDGNIYDAGPACVFGPDGSYVLQNGPTAGYVPVRINSAGTTCASDGSNNFAIWSNNGTEILSLPSGDIAECYGLNDYGVAVGLSVTGGSSYTPLIYDSLNGLRNLNQLSEHSRRAPGFSVLYAVGISNTGFIAANCEYTGLHRTAEMHACLLTPNTVRILKDNVTALAQGDPDCIQCRAELGPLVEELPNTLVGLTPSQEAKVSGIVRTIATDLLGLYEAHKINQEKEALLNYDCQLVQRALHRD